MRVRFLCIHRKAVTVLVADIDGFSELILALSDANSLALYGKYVGLVEEVCRNTKGMLSSLQGDRLVLSWNAATNVGAHALQVWVRASASFFCVRLCLTFDLPASVSSPIM